VHQQERKGRLQKADAEGKEGHQGTSGMVEGDYVGPKAARTHWIRCMQERYQVLPACKEAIQKVSILLKQYKGT